MEAQGGVKGPGERGTRCAGGAEWLPVSHRDGNGLGAAKAHLPQLLCPVFPV